MQVNLKIQVPLYICILNISTELSDIKTTNTVAIGRDRDSNTLYKSTKAFVLIWHAKLQFHLTNLQWQVIFHTF